jgi:hypothetical protein
MKMSSGLSQRVVGQRRFDVLMMEAVSTSETQVNFCQTTRHNSPEDSHLQTNLCSLCSPVPLGAVMTDVCRLDVLVKFNFIYPML